jgi:hypothetical protein
MSGALQAVFQSADYNIVCKGYLIIDRDTSTACIAEEVLVEV